MKTGKSLVELATECDRRANAKHDYVAKTEAIRMELDPDFDRLINSDFDRLLRLGVGTEKFGINSIAHDQLGNWSNIPAAYYDRMLREQPELLAKNVNTWLAAAAGQKRMVRTLDGNARAFLSDKYRPLENEDLLEAILPILLGDGRFDIMSCEVTDRRLYLKVVSKDVTRELAKTGNYFGDGKHKIVRILAPAITISNSEVGQGRLSIQAGAYDSFCSNLATFAERSMKKHHVGSRHDLLSDETFALLSDDTRRKTDEALWSQVRDVVTNAFDATKFDTLVDTIQGTQADKIDKSADVVEVVKVAGRKLGITEGEQKGVLQALIEGGDLSRFGLYNAITRHSQDVESYDRATELERLGAMVVELPKHDWQEIAKAS